MIAEQIKTISSAHVRKNSYSKPCCNCKVQVKEYQGYIDNSKGYWATYCTKCYPFQIIQAKRELTKDGEIKTPYEPENLNIVRSFPGAKFNGQSKTWSVSLRVQDRQRVIELATRLGLEIDPSLMIDGNNTENQQIEEEFVLPELPKGKKLFDYQVTGIKFLAGRKRALLGDDMGLGKSAQSLLALPKNARVLVICPNCVKGNWANEVKMWRSDLNPIIIKGRNKFVAPEENQVVIVNYDILPADAPEGWGSLGISIIADEAHMVKSHKAIRSKKVKNLTQNAERVWFLTGTPLLNRPFDLWGVLSGCQLERDAFGSFTGFLNAFGGTKNQRWGGYEFSGPKPYVAEKLRNVMLRRLKREVLTQLPPRLTSTIPVADLSKDIQKQMDDLWENDEISALDKDDELPPFERFSLIRAGVAKEKIPALIELIEQYEESETPILVFSAHREPVLTIGEREGWACITGTTSAEERTDIVAKFQAGQYKGVALTIQAGGVGLTLTRASTVIMNDLDWTPALNEQAISRIERIGQNAESIQVVHLVADHPLEKHIHNLLTYKMEMQSTALDNAPLQASLPKQFEQIGETQEQYLARMEQAKESKVEQVKIEQEISPSRAEAKVRYWLESSEQAKRPITEENRKAVKDAFSFMLSRCDGAFQQDNLGFNKPDVMKARTIMMVGFENDEVVSYCWNMLSKYKRQLGKNFPILFAKL